MLRGAAILIAMVMLAGRPALSENVEAKCLDAVTTGDALINCQKALVLLQRKQLDMLLNIRRLIARGTNRSAAKTVTNTGLTVQRLEEIARVLGAQGTRPSDFLFVTDLSAVGGSSFACQSDYEEECAKEARAAAHTICRKLGYGARHAHEFETVEGSENTIRIKWIVCRP